MTATRRRTPDVVTLHSEVEIVPQRRTTVKIHDRVRVPRLEKRVDPRGAPSMRIPRRHFLQKAASAAALSASSLNAWALDYPTRAIHWVIGFPPGGGADIVARIMGAWLSERLGQQIIIENKPGAATNIATQTVINSPADGYTLLWAGISNVINATIYGTLPFDFLRDIAPVSGMVVYPMVFEVNPSKHDRLREG
jgi:hypothetical protein